jgi:hypothetical protein
MAAAGGYIAAHALYPKKPLGQAYDEAMQSQVFDPLGMKDSTLDANNASQKDHATPHEWDLGGNCVSVSLSSEHWTAPVRPAMGVWSSIDDMTRYLLMELSKGKGPDGSVVVSKENLLKRREPQAKMSDKSSYGLGLIVSDNHGLDYFGHDGTVTGFTSSMAFYPDLGIGIIILANVDKSELFTNGVRARLLEILFDKKPKIQDELNEAWDKKSSHDRLVDYFSDFKDEDFFRKLKGDYSNENLGPISIQFKDRGVYLVTDGWTVPLASFKRGKDTVDSIILGGPPMIGVQMKVNENKGHVLLTLETPQKDYVFDQIAPEKGK